MYRLLRKLLFQFDPEFVHYLALNTLKLSHSLKLTHLIKKPPAAPVNLMGLTFPNPIGLAAGFDRDANYIDALSTLGFGFIEVGTVTPLAQKGNPKPRIIRLPKEEGIINRMGFANAGVDEVVEHLKQIKYSGILGINIGKNPATPNEHALDDYLHCFEKLSPFAHYITINISSPNTVGLRQLQHGELFNDLIAALKKAQLSKPKYVNLVLKLSPDLSLDELNNIATVILQHKIDGVIAANTSLNRDGVEHTPQAAEKGGLSGRPIHSRSNGIIQALHAQLQNKIPIIGSGGVMDEITMQQKITAGAKLIQVYTGLIYNGPSLIHRLIRSYCHPGEGPDSFYGN